MIKKNKIYFCFLLSVTICRLSALDLSSSFNIGNFGFDNDMSNSSMGVLWGSSIIAEQKISDNFIFSGGAVADDVSGNRMESRIIFNSSYFIVGLGPSVASVNNGQFQLKPALNGFVTIKKDGKFSFSTEIYSTMGNLSDRENDYSQLEASIALSLNIPGALCTFTVESRQFSQFSIDSLSVISKTTDRYSNYELEADLHKKNIPFHVILTLGYKNHKRLFPVNDPSGRTMMGIGTAFIGAGTRVNIGKKIVLQAGIDSGLYNFTLSEELSPTDLPAYLFDLHTTFTYRF